MDIITTIIIVLICLIIEGFFSGSEIALISVNRIRIKHKAEEGSNPAQLIEDLLNTPERIFGTTSVGTNLAVVTGTAVVTAFLMVPFGGKEDLYALLIMAPLTLLLGEIIPKALFQLKADQISMKIIYPLRFALTLFYPIIVLVAYLTNLILKTIMGENDIKEHFITREGIKGLVRIGIGGGKIDLDVDKKRMIHKIFGIGSTTIDKCMVPLINVVAIDEGATVDHAIKKVEETGFSRIPVFRNNIYNIVGILNTFDLLGVPDDMVYISDLIKPPYYIPTSKKVDALLRDLQDKDMHIAVIVDEYGSSIGIVTIEDLLEEIVGEIEDEYDSEVKLYETIPHGGYLIDAKMEIEAINEKLRLGLPEGDYETLGGFIINLLESIPKPGEIINYKNLYMRIKDANERCVRSIYVMHRSHSDKKG
ncbi:MAG: HlyC/CorC family transporter [Nitrospinae bacterium]|nr:HlyC/CorC family transporter [Nitrospinota bacterium]